MRAIAGDDPEVWQVIAQLLHAGHAGLYRSAAATA